METLAKLNEAFIERAHRTFDDGRVPIRAVRDRRDQPPITPSNRWETVTANDVTVSRKTFKFVDNEHRNKFLCSLLDHEAHYGHTAAVSFRDRTVAIVLTTKNVAAPTELDIEYARYCDVLFKDLIYKHNV